MYWIYVLLKTFEGYITHQTKSLCCIFSEILFVNCHKAVE